MNKEQQNIAWKCLPKEVRDEIKGIYTSHIKRQNITSQDTLLDKLFGRENLESDTEPEEILMVERKKVVQWYSNLSEEHKIYAKGTTDRISLGARLAMLEESFTKDKCLPDTPNTPNSGELKPQVADNKPKFEIGQPVRVLAERAFGRIEKIEVYDVDDNTYRLEFLPDFWFEPSELEPYTEEKETMEEKELNRKVLYNALCELESASVKVRKALISM